MFRNLIYIILLIVSVHSNIAAYTNLNKQSIMNSVVQEKVAVVLDKDGYMAGDTIRFRAFLLDACTEQKLSDFSQYIYLELIDPFGNVTSRIKVKSKDGIFAGIIPLDRELPESIYTLSAYTLFSRNIPEDYFFRMPVSIASSYSPNYRIDYSIENYVLSARLLDVESNKPMPLKVLKLISPENEVIREAHNKSFLSTRIPPNIPVAKVKFDNYEKFIALPGSEDKVVIDFYPEGESLITGTSNAVAFKASDSFGRWKSISGYVENSRGEKVAKLESICCGNGIFHIVPQAGEEYWAVVDDRRFKLPPADELNTSLKIVSSGNKIIVDVLGRCPSQNVLSVNVNGATVIRDSIVEYPVTISILDIKSGLVNFELFDFGMNRLSSRLFYNFGNNECSEKGVDEKLVGDFAMFMRNRNSPRINLRAMLLQQDLGGYIDSLNNYFTATKRNVVMDALLLSEKAERYSNAVFEYPVEMGGEISGVIKSRWRNRPIKNAKINIIAPSIGLATEANTDSDGRFLVDGFDWPEGTAFVCQAIGTKGQKEHNFTIEVDSFPKIKPILIRYGIDNEDDYTAIINRNGERTILLDDVLVTAPYTKDDHKAILFSAMGIKSVTEKDFKDKAITSYEEAIRTFPALGIEDGRIVSRRGKSSIFGGGEVEIWIDGVQWNASFLSQNNDHTIPTEERRLQLSSQASKTAIIMTGGLLPDDVAQRQYASQLSVINELSGSYPFSMVKSIEYVPPQSALFLSNTAAYNGGALVITTKSGYERDWSDELFLQIHRPLGYQSDISALSSLESDDYFWFPTLATVKKLHEIENCTVYVCGFTDNGDFILQTVEMP